MTAYLPLSTHSGDLHHPQAGLERHPAGQPCQFATLASVCPLLCSEATRWSSHSNGADFKLQSVPEVAVASRPASVATVMVNL